MADVTLYVWDAGRYCGVSGDLGKAQEHVTAYLTSEAAVGRIEEVRHVIGWGLESCYEHTGRTWTAYSRADGTASWDPVSHERVPAVS